MQAAACGHWHGPVATAVGCEYPIKRRWGCLDSSRRALTRNRAPKARQGAQAPAAWTLGLVRWAAVGDSGPPPGLTAVEWPQNTPQIRHEPGFTLPPSRHRHAPSGADAPWHTASAQYMRIPRPTPTQRRQQRRHSQLPAGRRQLQGPVRSPIGIDAAGKSAQHDQAAYLATKACSGQPMP